MISARVSRYRLVQICLFAGLAAFASARAATPPVPLGGAKKVLFLGDSITYSGQYIDYVEAGVRLAYPALKVEFINVGLPSETVSGLSEPGHAGGSFPRPDLHERLDRVLAKVKPDLVLACYGMNDGIYYPYGDDRAKKFQEGMQRLRDKVKAAGARIVHVTPPVFDPQPMKGHTLPAGREEYRQPYEGYNDVLDKYSAWLMGQRTNGWEVIDAHTPMNAYLATRRREEPDFVLAGDGVHANATGHWLIAQEILQGLGVPGGSKIAAVDAKTGQASKRDTVNVSRLPDGALQLSWSLDPSSPRDPAWDKNGAHVALHKWYRDRGVAVRNLEGRVYDVYEEDKWLGAFSGEELGYGSEFHKFPEHSVVTNGHELLKLLRQKNQILTDAWLNETGHLRPGMSKGVPLAEAQGKAAELDARIVKLAGQRVVSLRFKESQAPFPGKKSDWNGFDRYDFTFNSRPLMVVVPKTAAPGKPWVWHGEFFGHKPAPDIALLSNGFHVVYATIPDMFGNVVAVRHWNAVHGELALRYGLAKKVALVGLSRGGLYCYNWAASNADKVACIYGDAPVCDLKSWPGGKGKGKGSPRDWALVMLRFNFKTETEALAYDKNPVDNLARLAEAKVPLLHVYGDADDVVPWEENTGLLAKNYKELGGDITLIAKPGVGHHPHGLDDSTPIVDFIRQHATVK